MRSSASCPLLDFSPSNTFIARNIRRAIYACTTLLLLATAGEARVLLVDRSRPASGSVFHTIQAAVNAAQPGDDIRVRRGRYVERIRTVRSGSPSAPIVIRGLPGAELISPNRHEGRLVSIYHNDIVLHNMTIRGGNILIFIFGGARNQIHSNILRDAGGECVRIRFNSRQNVIRDNRIELCGRTGFDLADGEKNGEGIYVGTAPEQLDSNADEHVPANAPLGQPNAKPDRSDGNFVLSNVINAPAECVDIKESSSANKIRHNLCMGNLDPESAGFASRGNRNVFHANRLSGPIAGAGIRFGGDVQDQGILNSAIANVLKNTGGYALKDERLPQWRICGNRIGNNADGRSKSGINPARPC